MAGATARGADAAIREAAVLAGGRSRRMGSDKALLHFDGETLLARMLKRLARRFARLIVSVGIDGPSAAVVDVVESLRREGLSIRIVPDAKGGALGPLAAIETVLGAIDGPGVFVVAVDIPQFSMDVAGVLLQRASAPACRAALPRWRGGIEPLFAVYKKSILEHVTRRVEQGALAVHELASDEGVEIVDIDEAQAEDLFLNVNTPADLEIALRPPRGPRRGGGS